MKHFITSIIFISSVSCFGQNKEYFLNSIYRTFLDTLFNQYYLYTTSHRLSIGIYDKQNLIKDLSHHTSIETINELISKSESDTLEMTWNCESLDLANCVTTSEGILIGDFVVNIDKKWSNRRRKRETDRQVAEEKEKHNKKPIQDKVIYSFSRPIFDRNNEYALISMQMICGSTCGHRCIYLFNNVKGSWVLVKETNCKMS